MQRAIGAGCLILRRGESLPVRHRGVRDSFRRTSRGQLRSELWSDVGRGFHELRELGLIRLEV